jgi:hypothetical protein
VAISKLTYPNPLHSIISNYRLELRCSVWLVWLVFLQRRFLIRIILVIMILMRSYDDPPE